MYKVLRLREYEKIKRLEGRKYTNGEVYLIPETKYCCDVVAYDLDRQERRGFSFTSDEYNGAYDELIVGDLFDIFLPEYPFEKPVVRLMNTNDEGDTNGTVE